MLTDSHPPLPPRRVRYFPHDFPRTNSAGYREEPSARFALPAEVRASPAAVAARPPRGGAPLPQAVEGAQVGQR